MPADMATNKMLRDIFRLGYQVLLDFDDQGMVGYLIERPEKRDDGADELPPALAATLQRAMGVALSPPVELSQEEKEERQIQSQLRMARGTTYFAIVQRLKSRATLLVHQHANESAAPDGNAASDVEIPLAQLPRQQAQPKEPQTPEPAQPAASQSRQPGEPQNPPRNALERARQRQEQSKPETD